MYGLTDLTYDTNSKYHITKNSIITSMTKSLIEVVMKTSYAVSSDYNAAFSSPAVLREGIGNVKTKALTLPFHAK